MESHPEPHQEVFHMKVESSDGGTLNITIDGIDSGGKTIVCEYEPIYRDPRGIGAVNEPLFI